MLIYNYNPITFEYISKEEAGKNPLNPEEPIIPACATIIEPLEPQEGYVVVWIGNKWKYKEDHRGETWYNAETDSLEIINFIGELSSNYYSPDSPIANKPEGDYWVFNEETQSWEGNSVLFKKYITDNFDILWNLKQNTPFEFEGHKYIPAWRDLYDSIFNTLDRGIKESYRLQDYDGCLVEVTLETMRPIYVKMANVVDDMYIDKQNLQMYALQENDFIKLKQTFDAWLMKKYE